MARKRKMTTEDRTILAQVFKSHGRFWTYRALASWFIGEGIKDIPGRWTGKRLAAFRFLRELIDVYTFNAIYAAAKSIQPGCHEKPCGKAA